MPATQRFVIALPLIATAIIACGPRNPDPRNHNDAAPILLFTGGGASPSDVDALETILDANHLSYATVRSPELTTMTVEDLRRYRLLIVPGGDFVRMGDGLTPAGVARIRDAVHQGMNYLGVCAGAFLAGDFPRPYKGLNLTSGVQFRFYDAVRRVHKTPVAVTTAEGSTLDQYWEDGPQLTGWGAVVAKYPDGTPAIVQGWSGEGWLVLTGVHPEAPENWRRGMMFNTPPSTDNAFAAALIQAALHRTPLKQF
jgi:glutamine amidotransferase-like uncharacterized protein